MFQSSFFLSSVTMVYKRLHNLKNYLVFHFVCFISYSDRKYSNLNLNVIYNEWEVVFCYLRLGLCVYGKYQQLFSYITTTRCIGRKVGIDCELTRKNLSIGQLSGNIYTWGGYWSSNPCQSNYACGHKSTILTSRHQTILLL